MMKSQVTVCELPRSGQVGVNPHGLSLAVRRVPIERTATETGKLCERESSMRGVNVTHVKSATSD